MNSNFTWNYDEFSRHYIVRNARVLFANFAGAAQDYNQEGRRNFRLEIPEDLAQELEEQGIYVRTREARDDSEDTQRLVKVSVYPDAEIRFLNGRAMSKVIINNDDKDCDQGKLIDNEFRKGHIMNGEIKIEFHISKNTRVATSSPYLRIDTMILPLRKSQLLEEYENDYEEEDAF